MSHIEIIGKSFEEVCERARLRSLTPDYQGCAVHVNALVSKGTTDTKGRASFTMAFALSDWHSTESTVTTFVNGVER